MLQLLRAHTRFTKLIAFASIVGALFAISYLAGTHGVFSSAERHLQASLDDPETRDEATESLANRLAASLANGNAVFAGPSDSRACPGRYSAQATSVIAAIPAATARATLNDAASQLRQGGWTVDAANSTTRVSVHAHNRHGIVVEVTEASDSDSTSIEVTVTVPCDAVASHPTIGTK